MDKKSTVLLTVIAVATLLVAVVGSTFAFFAIQETNTADVKVETSTAKGSDIFSATSAGELSLTVNNDDMLETNGGKEGAFVSDTDANMTIELTAGTGKATCGYDIIWEDSSVEPYARSKYMVKEGETEVEKTVEGYEYTIQGSKGGDEIEEINVSDITSNDKGQKVLGHFTIENTAGEAKTVQTWNYTVKFYNLAVNQGKQMGKTYVSNIKVANVSCSNASTTPEQN